MSVANAIMVATSATDERGNLMVAATLERDEDLLRLDRQKNAILLTTIDASADNVRMELKAAHDSNRKVLNALRTDFTELRGDFKELHEFMEVRVDGLETSVDGLTTRVGGLETSVDSLTTRVGGLEADLKEVRQEMQAGFKEIIERLPEK
jgi:predicted  nucleic acid-binding Zn-ribbon protein